MDDTVALATGYRGQIPKLIKLLEGLLANHEFKTLTCNNLAAAIQRVADAKGQGGLLVIETADVVDNDVLPGMKSRLNPSQLSVWRDGKLYGYSVDGLVQMIIPDGAMLIGAKTYRVDNQVQIIPIDRTQGGGVAVDLAGVETDKFNTKGTKHRTAKAITTVSASLTAICISADGPVAVFQNGEELLPSGF